MEYKVDYKKWDRRFVFNFHLVGEIVRFHAKLNKATKTS